MAVREFEDSYGQGWRAWDVTPESIYPQTRAEDYLADCYRGGWIVFETLDGAQKRRLCPLPYAWEQRSVDELRRLLDAAEIIVPRPASAPRDAVITVDLPPNVPPEAAVRMPRLTGGDLDLAALGVVRSFVHPGGRVWSACLTDDGEGGPVVLRFVSGARTVDLQDWPPDWIDYSDTALAALVSGETADRDRPREASAEPNVPTERDVRRPEA